MKKYILVFITLLLCACSPVKKEELDKPVTLSFFYIETCLECKKFKKKVIPLLEETFDENITIQLYDLDDEATQIVYDGIIDSLEDFDFDMYGNGPFIVVEDYFAKLGYVEGDEDYLIEDIKHAIKGEELSYELEAFRYLYKD